MERHKILLFSPKITSRLRYIALHLVENILGTELVFTTDIEEARLAGIPLINYTDSYMAGAVNIVPHGLLYEKNVCNQNIDIERVNGKIVLFRSPGHDDTGFDLFAASFYMISRYEEYLPGIKDEHGRFPFSGSLACRYSFADEPVVDLWAAALRESIVRKYPAVYFPEREFTFIPTIDVDIPWAYKNRGLWRTAGGFARSALKGDIDELIFRYRVLFNGRKDPFDTFRLIETVHGENGLSPIFFFSAGTYGKFDKSVPVSHPAYSRLIDDLSSRYGWGIHPSWLSYNNSELLKKETEMLTRITGEAPVRSRQHYLRLCLPDTYRYLSESGISEDYTMGWAETAGFRAGTCTPYMFYDLEGDEITGLKIFPFQIMDGSLCDYMKLPSPDAAEFACRIVEKVKDVNGTLVTLWHNESFSGTGRWKNWENVYLEIIRAAT
ncbi:MAG: polysaccharide deacetylase family protein [Bacteroidales bacterium]